jgi:SAM-dependent methyltransferase
MVALYPSAVEPRNSRNWDRETDLQAIRDTYDGYDASGRARLWDERAPGYARLAAELQASLVRSLESVASTGARILDLGCGDGVLAAETHLSSTASEWIGVDLRQEAIATARERFPNLTFMVASGDEVPLDDASLDVVVARLLFSSLPSADLEASVAAEIQRLVRPGGWLVWLDLRYANPTNRAVHGMSRSRIAGLFPGWKTDLRSAGLLPPLARRLGRTTRIAYPALAALPVLRSHLVGRLRNPASPG